MPIAGKVLDVASNIPEYAGQVGEYVGQVGEGVSNLLEYGGEGGGVLNQLAQLGGVYKAGKGAVELVAGDDKYQGAEDIVQGAIAFA